MEKTIAAALLCAAALVAWILGCGSTPEMETTCLPTVAPPPAPRPEPTVAPVPPPPVLTTRSPAAPLTPTPAVRRPARVRGELDTPLGRRWKYIVLHHSATDSGSAAVFDRYAKQKLGWRGVGYDFVIGNGKGCPDGMVETTFRWEQQTDGAHAGVAEYNKYGIGICLVGNFERSYATHRQVDSLVALVNYLQGRCEIPTHHIYGHRHVRPKGTLCPGRNFPWYELFSRIEH